MLLRNGKHTIKSSSDYFEGESLDYNETHNSEYKYEYNSLHKPIIERISYSEFIYNWNFYICFTVMFLYLASVFSVGLWFMYQRLDPMLHPQLCPILLSIYSKLHIYYSQMYATINNKYDKILYDLTNEYMNSIY
jgi:hypothetical protein